MLYTTCTKCRICEFALHPLAVMLCVRMDCKKVCTNIGRSIHMKRGVKARIPSTATQHQPAFEHTHTHGAWARKKGDREKKSLSKWQLIYFPTLHRTKNLHSCLHICCWLGENAIHTDCNSYRGFSSFCLSRGAPRMNIFFRCLSSVSGAVPSVFHHVHCRQSLFLRPYVVAAASPLLPLTATVVCLPKCHHIALAIRGARDQLHILRTHILYTRWRI